MVKKRRQVVGVGVECWGEWTTVYFFAFFRSLWPDYVALVLSVCPPCLELQICISLQEGLSHKG